VKFLLAIILPLYALDQITKWATIAAFDRGTLPRVVIPPDVFELVFWQNTGAAFSLSLFKDPRMSNWFYIGLSCIAFIGLIIAWKRRVFVDAPSRWAVALLLSGILGNLTDRIVHGFVVDMLKFDFGFAPFHPWPAFNVADSAICIAVGLFIIASFRAPASARANAS
jgi:signal peptidase II